MTPHLVIAIDGPSGVGKSSTSHLVAEQLNCAYLDSGSMYRALAVWCHHKYIDPADIEMVARTAQYLDFEINTDPKDFRIGISGVDLTDDLHHPEVSAIVSGYAANKTARQQLNQRMRELITDRGRIVVEGRDITTVVAPDADVRILLQADPQRRIARRDRQLGGTLDAAMLTQQVVGRDAADSKNAQFDTPADGVTLIDSSELDLQQVVAAVIDLVPAELRVSNS